ncbi:hypothetical protein AB9E06_21850 [Rhizobium leguminosarum]|uniref:hypothetical protein n=1 Tax=Rhizobium leguminosarum TaxID=384 RepID=UPI003F9A2E83
MFTHNDLAEHAAGYGTGAARTSTRMGQTQTFSRAREAQAWLRYKRDTGFPICLEEIHCVARVLAYHEFVAE